MHWFKAIWSELLGLFVDDGSFAIAILVWLGMNWLLSTYLLRQSEWGGVVLFAGLGLILLESATRRSRR
jgi:hypothetical protein